MAFTDLPPQRVDDLNRLLSSYGQAFVVTKDEDDDISKELHVLFPQTQRMIADMKRACGVNAKIYCCFVLDQVNVFQACAVQFSGDEHCIAIWLTVPLRNFLILSHLLQTKTATDYFGLPESNTKMPVANFTGSTFEAYVGLARCQSSKMLPPIGHLCTSTSTAAYMWIVFHEIGHIFNGHLAFGSSLNAMRYILEAAEPGDIDNNLTSHAMEMDADAFATAQMLGLWLKIRLVEGSVDQQSGHGNLVLNKARSLFFGIESMVRAFDYDVFDAGSLFAFDHPPGAMRMNALVSQVATMMLSGKYRALTEDIAAEAISALVALERAISEASGVPSRGGNFLAASALPWSHYHQKVLARWAKLYPLLSERKLHDRPLAAPQFPPA